MKVYVIKWEVDGVLECFEHIFNAMEYLINGCMNDGVIEWVADPGNACLYFSVDGKREAILYELKMR